MRRKHAPLTDEIIQGILDRSASHNVPDLARSYKVSAETVRKILRVGTVKGYRKDLASKRARTAAPKRTRSRRTTRNDDDYVYSVNIGNTNLEFRDWTRKTMSLFAEHAEVATDLFVLIRRDFDQMRFNMLIVTIGFFFLSMSFFIHLLFGH